MSSVIVSLLSSFDPKGINDAEKAFGAFKSKMAGVSKSLAVGVGSALAGAGAVSFVKDSVSAAADLQQAMSGVKTIFGSMQPQIQGYINDSAKMGMSTAEAAKAVTFLGSVFKQTGMPMENVIGHTKQMVSLATDLAATYGYSVEEALTAMTATFRGEYDPIEKFGVAMKQQQVNAELAARGLKGLTGSALIAAQQQIRYEMILQRTTDAQGAFGRQSGNLATQMMILKAVWTNMQAQLGNKLVPILAQLTVKLQPLITNVAPHLAKVFEAIGNALVSLIPLMPKLAELASRAFDAFSNAVSVTTPLITALIDFMITHFDAVVGFIAAFVGFQKILPIIQGLRIQFKLFQMELGRTEAARVFAELSGTVEKTGFALRGLKAAQLAFNTAVKANAYILIGTAIAGAVGLLNEFFQNGRKAAKQYEVDLNTVPRSIYNQAKAAGEAAKAAALSNKAMSIDASVAATTAMQQVIQQYKDSLKEIDRQNKAWEGRYPSGAMYEALYGKKPVMTTGGGTTTGSGKAVKTWFDNLAEEIKKQTDRMKLGKLGLSKALIDSLLSASDWQTAVAKVMGMTKKQIEKLIKDFSKTSAAQDAAAQDLADRTQKFVDAVKLRVDTIKSLTGDLSTFVPQSYADATKSIGQFESAVISASDSLKSNLQQALDNKGITQAAYNNLLAYANREVAVLQKIAAARDNLVAKIEAAKATYLEVSNAVRSYGNITSTTTQQVTESYVKWIDGVEVTVSKTVDALQNKDLVKTYKDIVDKTKAFVKNLSDIKKMGLNSTLFKQIVDAGVDAGVATAQAIVDGGQATVSSLNDLFGQLDSAGAQMADMTAQVMSDNGVTIVSAFIDGLVSQESALADEAKSLAQIFTDAFNNNVKFSIPQIKPSDYGLTDAQGKKALEDAGLDPNQGGTGKNDFPVTILPSLPTDVIPKVVTAVTTLADGLDRVERAGAGVGALAAVNTSAATGYASAGWSIAGLSSAATTMSNNAPTYNVTVNAGMGTDGSSVGQTIVQLLKQYERNNGAVWVSSV